MKTHNSPWLMRPNKITDSYKPVDMVKWMRERRVREKWSRQVSAGFTASEVERVTETNVYLTGGRSCSLEDLNLRELDEVFESLRPNQ